MTKKIGFVDDNVYNFLAHETNLML